MSGKIANHEWSERLRGTEMDILWDLEALQRDPATAELIRQGRTMGCFYIESPSMRSLFQRMTCECYEDVVAASSIIRPGVAESGMMKTYVERYREARSGRREAGGERQEARGQRQEVRGEKQEARSQKLEARGEKQERANSNQRSAFSTQQSAISIQHLPDTSQSKLQNPTSDKLHPSSFILHPSKIEYLHPALEELLSETFGVMVYQEDVIKVVHALGGLTLGEADILRRAMSGKAGAQEAMESLTERFFAGCRARGVAEEVIQELWRQIETFARFSFCKGHSAAFAVLSYQVTYLKAHYPAEFMAAVLSNGGGYYGAAAYIQECRRMGLRVLGPDINESQVDYTGQTEGTWEAGSEKGEARSQRQEVRGERQEAEGRTGCQPVQSAIPNPKSKIQNLKSAAVHPSSFILPPSPVGWLRVGFGAIKNFPLELARRIIQERCERPFDSLADFLRRVRPGHEAAEKLIRVGAFDHFGIPRERLLIDLDIYFSQTNGGENWLHGM